MNWFKRLLEFSTDNGILEEDHLREIEEIDPPCECSNIDDCDLQSAYTQSFEETVIEYCKRRGIDYTIRLETIQHTTRKYLTYSKDGVLIDFNISEYKYIHFAERVCLVCRKYLGWYVYTGIDYEYISVPGLYIGKLFAENEAMQRRYIKRTAAAIKICKTPR